MIKKIILFNVLMICIIGQSFLSFSQTPTLYPIFDAPGIDVPRNLRIVQVNTMGPSFNSEGLKDLKISGSGQFSEKTFSGMMHQLPISPGQLVVIDLRQESHGFINGKSVSWTDGIYNYGNLHKTQSEIETDESDRLQLAVQKKRMVINPHEDPTKLTVHTIKTERAFIEDFGSIYVRLPVTDHNRPTNEVIDQFIEIVRNLPSNRWLHFHCRAGKGRTTTFLTLFDMMKNAQQVSLSDILSRQQFIGGSRLSEFATKEGEKRRAAESRLDFIQQFYLYCRQVPDFQIKWSTWLEQQQPALVSNH